MGRKTIPENPDYKELTQLQILHIYLVQSFSQNAQQSQKQSQNNHIKKQI